MAKAEVEVQIKAKDDASRQLDSISGKINNMSRQLTIAGGAMAAFGAAVMAGLGIAAKAAAAEEAATTRMVVAMENMGISYDAVKGSLEAWIDTQQQKTSIADTAQRQSLASLIRMTGDLASSQDMLTLAMDIAVGTSRELESATTLVMYAMGGNWGMLERYIPALKTIQDEEGKWAKLRELFAGQAEAYGQTLQGQFDLLKNNFGDVSEATGAFVAQALQPLIEKVNTFIQRIKAWIEIHPQLAKIIVWLAGGTGIAALVTGFGLLATVLWVKLIPAVTAAVAALWAKVTAMLAAIAATGYGVPIAIAAAAAITMLAVGISALVESELKQVAAVQQSAEATSFAAQVQGDYNQQVQGTTDSINAQIQANRQLAGSMGDVAMKAHLAYAKRAMAGEKLTPFELEQMRLFGEAVGIATKTPAIIAAEQAAARQAQAIQYAETMPQFQQGGVMPYTGMAHLEKGETVLPSQGGGKVPMESIINLTVNLDGQVLTRVTNKHMGEAYLRRRHMRG